MGRSGTFTTDKIMRALIQDAFASNSRDNMSVMLVRNGVFEPHPLSSRAILSTAPLPCASPLLLPAPPHSDENRIWFERHVEFLRRHAYPNQAEHLQQLNAFFADQSHSAE
jgi:hypothetical protein